MKKLMIIGVGWEQMPLVKKAKEKNLSVIVTSQWKENVPFADRTYWIDSREIEALEKVFLEEKPDGILADECDYSMFAVAYLTEKYHLPGPSLEALTITNNKALQRNILSQTNILQPEFYECWNYEQVMEAAKKLSYPLVVKSIDNRGSIGVFIVKEEAKLKDAWYGALVNAHSRKVLVEQFIDGDIVTADGFCSQRGFCYIASSTKDSYEGTSSVAKVLYYPGKLNSDQLEHIKEASAEIVRHFGITYGFTHFEFLVEKKTGDLYFVEGANRGGGVFISNLILKEISGIDWVEELIHMALGQESTITFDRKYKKDVLMYFVQSGDGTLQAEQIADNHKEVIAVHMNPGSGKSTGEKTKADARERQGVLVLTGQGHEQLYKSAVEIEKRIEVSSSEYDFIRA